MVSVVMPYWMRRDILKENLAHYRAFYAQENIEIIVVDDGSPEPAEVNDSPFPVRVIRLADKNHALNPCVPLNLGVENARGDIIVLTNPEVIHRGPILGPMRDRLKSLGPKGYVAAACWGGWWYCHSTLMPEASKVGRARMPEGAGLHFCSMLYRDFFQSVGGFCEDYRNGQGYEDNDFLWRLDSAGARFAIMDDLVCDHIECPRSQWPAGNQNKEIFNRAWPDN